MTDTTRAELLRALERFWEYYPELRFGQMVANLADWARDYGPDAVGRVEDDELLAAVKDHLVDAEQRAREIHSAIPVTDGDHPTPGQGTAQSDAPRLQH